MQLICNFSVDFGGYCLKKISKFFILAIFLCFSIVMLFTIKSNISDWLCNETHWIYLMNLLGIKQFSPLREKVFLIFPDVLILNFLIVFLFLCTQFFK